MKTTKVWKLLATAEVKMMAGKDKQAIRAIRELGDLLTTHFAKLEAGTYKHE